MRESALLKIIFLSLVILFSKSVSANNVAPDDQPYFSFKTGNYNFIFPKEYRAYADKVIQTVIQLTEHYEKIYDFSVDEPTDVMIASHFSQLGNGYATMSPNSQTVMYPGGIFLFDEFATTNWLATLVYEKLFLHLCYRWGVQSLTTEASPFVSYTLYFFYLLWKQILLTQTAVEPSLVAPAQSTYLILCSL